MITSGWKTMPWARPLGYQPFIGDERTERWLRLAWRLNELKLKSEARLWLRFLQETLTAKICFVYALAGRIWRLCAIFFLMRQIISTPKWDTSGQHSILQTTPEASAEQRLLLINDFCLKRVKNVDTTIQKSAGLSCSTCAQSPSSKARSFGNALLMWAEPKLRELSMYKYYELDIFRDGSYISREEVGFPIIF